MTAIRVATERDVPDLVTMGMLFLAEEYAGAIVGAVDHVEKMARQLVAGAAMFVLEDRGGQILGMIGMLVYDHFLSGERVASPLCWWVNPDARRGADGMRLWRRGLEFARERGATRLQTSAPNPKTEQIYARLGLQRFEVHYQGRL